MPGRNDKTDYSRLREYFATHPILTVPYTAPSDNTRVTNVTQRISANKQVRQAQQGFAQRKQQIQAAKRQAYRQRKAAESPLQIPMTDDAVDAAIAAEERVANGPRFEQGSTRPSINTYRLASQYANMQSFYANLGSPNIMPLTSTQVRRNPGVAATQMQFGLDNPALTVLQVAAPTGPSTGVANAAGNAFRAGMNTAKPMVARLITSTGRAATAGGRQVAQNAPRVAASAAVNTIPMVAAAAPVAGDGSSDSGLGFLAIPAGLALTYGGYRFGKSKGWWKKAPTSQANPYVYAPDRRLFTWERPDSWTGRTYGAAQDKLKVQLKQEWNNAISSGTTQAFKDKYGLVSGKGRSKSYYSDQEVASRLAADELQEFQNLPSSDAYVLIPPTPSQKGWAYTRNAGRILTWTGIPTFGFGLYNGLNGSENSSASGGGEPRVRQSSPTQPKTGDQTVKSDTTVAVPWGQPAPVTTSNQQQLDSINEQWREQLNN